MLKPCPFCGCEAVLVNEFFDDYLVMCSNSGCAVEGPLKATSDEAETAWNARPDGVVEELIEAVRQMLDVIHESRGIDGWHMNGDILLWEQCEQVQMLEDALVAARAALTGEKK